MKVYGYDDTGVCRGELLAAEIVKSDLDFGERFLADELGWEVVFTRFGDARRSRLDAMADEDVDGGLGAQPNAQVVLGMKHQTCFRFNLRPSPRLSSMCQPRDPSRLQLTEVNHGANHTRLMRQTLAPLAGTGVTDLLDLAEPGCRQPRCGLRIDNGPPFSRVAMSSVGHGGPAAHARPLGAGRWRLRVHAGIRDRLPRRRHPPRMSSRPAAPTSTAASSAATAPCAPSSGLPTATSGEVSRAIGSVLPRPPQRPAPPCPRLVDTGQFADKLSLTA